MQNNNFRWELPHFRLDLSKLWNQTALSAPQIPTLAGALKQFESRVNQNNIGFYDWPITIEPSLFQAIEQFVSQWSQDLEAVLCIGIGGSYLGPLCIQNALGRSNNSTSLKIEWLSNIDPGEIRRSANFVKSHRTGAIVISKSGTTVETLSALFHLHPLLSPDHIAVITDPEHGELRRFSQKHNWKSFPVPSNIGGRFSVLSPVGLVPAALSGVSPKELIAGAKSMKERLENFQAEDHPAALLALAFQQWDKNSRSIHYLMPYWKSLRTFADWYVQLFAESLGKQTNAGPVGPTPVAALGTSDQHSVLQLIKQGPANKLVGFLDITSSKVTKVGTPDKLESEKLSYLFEQSFERITHQASIATQTSLHRSQIPTYRIETDALTAQSLGALFFFFELTCALAGELYNINAYDQPGVEETKILLKSALNKS